MFKSSDLYGPGDTKIIGIYINWSCHIMSVFYSAQNALRQIGNGAKQERYLDQKMASFKYNGQTFQKTLKEVTAILLHVSKELGLVYKKYSQNADDNWISIAAAVFSFCHNFKILMKEVGVGHSKIQVGKAENAVSYVTATDYGLEQPHHVLILLSTTCEISGSTVFGPSYSNDNGEKS